MKLSRQGRDKDSKQKWKIQKEIKCAHNITLQSKRLIWASPVSQIRGKQKKYFPNMEKINKISMDIILIIKIFNLFKKDKLLIY